MNISWVAVPQPVAPGGGEWDYFASCINWPHKVENKLRGWLVGIGLLLKTLIPWPFNMI